MKYLKLQKIDNHENANETPQKYLEKSVKILQCDSSTCFPQEPTDSPTIFFLYSQISGQSILSHFILKPK